MKLIIAGSRDLLVDAELVDMLIRFFRLKEVTEVVSGCGGNVDEAGEDWSEMYLEKKPTQMPALWMKEGKAAGPLRNSRMAKYADELLLVWDGKSKGSTSMKNEMIKLGKPVHEVILKV